MQSIQPRPIRVGATVPPQHISYPELEATWREVEATGADSLYVWDHFYPLWGDPEGSHLEAWTLLAAMAAVTERIEIGTLVTSISFRNPNLLADMARTVDQIAGGRLVLGLGAGWWERDYIEYGYDFKTSRERLKDLAAALPVIAERFARLNPGPVNGTIPLLIGGNGEQVTLRLAARYASTWSGFGDPTEMGRLNRVLDEWCARVDRDPNEIERSVLLDNPADVALADDYVANGVTNIIVGVQGTGAAMDPIRQLVAWRDERQPRASETYPTRRAAEAAA